MIYYIYMKQPNLVLLRHGESLWNKKNIFTGWVDIGLSSEGEGQAAAAGALLRKRGFVFDRAYASVLKRAVKTLWLCIESLDTLWLPTEKSWRLNERHYGALQGKSKKTISQEAGIEQFLKWRRGYSDRPPMARTRAEGEISAAACGISPKLMPKGESLADTIKRVKPYWLKEIKPALMRGERILIVAHGNSLRALVKELDGMSDQEIVEVEIPTGKPLCYNVSKSGKASGRKFLA